MYYIITNKWIKNKYTLPFVLLDYIRESILPDRKKDKKYTKDVKVIVYPHGSHLNGLMPNKEREKKLYRMIPLIGFMYKTFGKYRRENLTYFEQSEKEIIEWLNKV